MCSLTWEIQPLTLPMLAKGGRSEEDAEKKRDMQGTLFLLLPFPLLSKRKERDSRIYHAERAMQRTWNVPELSSSEWNPPLSRGICLMSLSASFRGYNIGLATAKDSIGVLNLTSQSGCCQPKALTPIRTSSKVYVQSLCISMSQCIISLILGDYMLSNILHYQVP